MSAKKCQIMGNKISPCETLARAIEYGNPRAKSKGLFVPERVNIKTGEPGTDIAQLHSGAFVGVGVALNFCPFCGETLKTWESTWGGEVMNWPTAVVICVVWICFAVVLIWSDRE